LSTYSYTAKNASGETKQGLLEANDKIEIARSLRRQGLVPVSIKMSEGGKEIEKSNFFISKIVKFDLNRIIDLIKGVSLADKMMFSRHLAVMISAGVSITRGLSVLSAQTGNYRFKKAIAGILEDIRKGKSFSDALSEYPKIFNSLYVSMVRSGETAGNMTEVLNLLSDQLRKEHELKSRVKGALMYPSVVVVAMTIIGVLMMVMVVPKIAAIFEDFGEDLPIMTKIFIGMSEILSGYWPFILGGFVPLIYMIKKFLATNAGKSASSWALLNMPILKPLTKKVNSARFARTLSSLIGGGVPILDAIKVTKDTLGNYYYRKSMDTIYEEIRTGKTLHESISKFGNIYPGLIVQMVEVGEETGELSDILNRIAEFYEEEVSNATKNLSSIIEPILMLVIGAAVGFFAISMIQPMYTLMGNV